VEGRDRLQVCDNDYGFWVATAGHISNLKLTNEKKLAIGFDNTQSIL
jgi:hypothetical protein